MRVGRWVAVVVLLIGGLLLADVIRVHRPDPDRVVSGGGITALGWTGVIDAQSTAQGRTINDSRFDQQSDGLHLTIGPAAYYWNPANVAAGTYTLHATFTEPHQVNNHPHPMGLFIGGSQLGTPAVRLMYCSAYRDGTFLVRAFHGSTVTDVVPKTRTPAVHEAAPSDPVTQEIAWSVNPAQAQCVINGTAVATLRREQIIGPDRLESIDGVWGIRVSHNMDLIVQNLALSKGNRASN
ncbi:MAG TPA: hypothetical protein VGZ27_05990 [Vicinamibacterales bacterium]|jgi:hypothetical protein|nr:hypothetical protein [Vicinamibacterales bacterium]